MTPEMNITTERIDDFTLLLDVMQRLGLPGIIDHHLHRHGLHQGLSWGWIATIWLAHILWQSNPCKQPVQSWVRQAQETIETNLLSLAVQFLTLIEFVVRRKFKQNQEKLVGLIENNPKKGIANPTTERLLKMFDNITLTIVQLSGQSIRHLPVLTAVQIRILELLGLSADVYTRLANN